MKIVDISIDDQDIDIFIKEVRLLKRLDSQFIIKYFDDFQLDVDNYCIITEFCEVVYQYLI